MRAGTAASMARGVAKGWRQTSAGEAHGEIHQMAWRARTKERNDGGGRSRWRAETLRLGTARWIDDGIIDPPRCRGGKSLTRTPHHVSTQLKTGLGEDGVVAPPAAVFRPCHSQQACT